MEEGGGAGFQDRDLAEIQELTDNMQQELTAMLPKMTQKQQCQKQTGDNLTEGC